MNHEDIIGRFRDNEAALRARGVMHVTLFGSRARGDDRPDSDTDIMIEIDPHTPIGVRHEYEDVAARRVLVTRTHDLPILLDVITKELAALDAA